MNFENHTYWHAQGKDSNRMRSIHNRKGTRYRFLALFDEASGWIAAALIGTLTACVAYLVDVAEATVSDWKTGFCKRQSPHGDLRRAHV
jgi:chloride channel 3/4/5